jgi:exonuclease III
LETITALTWNIRHGGGMRAPALAERIATFTPDVVVLTEFRANAAGNLLKEHLASQGLHYQLAASSAPTVNTVFIAAREPFQPLEAGTPPEPNRQRALLVRFPRFLLWGAYWPQGRAKIPLFNFVLEQSPRFLQEPVLLLGDLNTGSHFLDEPAATFLAVKEFEALMDAGWTDLWRAANPSAREFTWFSRLGNGFRVDHALASPSLRDRVQEVRYSHREREEGVSDHSPLCLRIGSH